MAHDISNNVVAILLVLVIAVAALGTWAFLTEFSPAPATSGPSDGDIALDIAGTAPDAAGTAAVQLQVAATEG